MSLDMSNHLSQVRALGYLILGAVGVGVAGLALITIVHPGVLPGVMRFLLLLIVSSGVVMAVVWAGLASALAIRWRLQEPD